MTIENAHCLVAELIEIDRNIIFIYITHLHRNDYLGMEVNKQKYPDARVIAYKKYLQVSLRCMTSKFSTGETRFLDITV